MSEMLKRLCKEEDGQDLTEYALILVLISLVSIAAMKVLGSAVSSTFSNSAENVSSAAS